jgi:hypothetical protein
MDRAARFFEDRCIFGGIERVLSSDLRTDYEDWCHEQGVRTPLSGKDFAARLTDRGCASTKSHGRRFWSGVRLLGDDDEGGAGVTRGHQIQELPHESGSQRSFSEMPTPADPRAPRDDLDDLEREAIRGE